MENTRYENGMEQLRRIDGAGGATVIQSLQDISSDLGKYIIEFAFGDIYTRNELNLQEREIITITSLLTAGGCEPQLRVHINGALNVGITPEKIVETFLQCVPYTGFPYEWFGSAEYILSEGNNKVILCERGVNTSESFTRNTLDLSIVAAMKNISCLPVIVDPSHGTGKRELIEPMCLSGIMAGCDGVMVEVHDFPQEALSDGEQALLPTDFKCIVDKADITKRVYALLNSTSISEIEDISHWYMAS